MKGYKIDFSEGVDPIELILKGERIFLHEFKNYASGLDRPKGLKDSNDDMIVYQGIANDIAHYLNNFRLILSCCLSKMPDRESSRLTSILVQNMDEAWEGRESLGPKMLPLADKIIMAYLDLANYLKSMNSTS